MCVWEMLKEGAEERTKVIWFPHGHNVDLETAHRRASQIAAYLGVVCSERGLGLRVRKQDFHEHCASLLGLDAATRLSTDKWRVSNVPASWGRAAMESAKVTFGWQDVLVE